jgi:hypothetical protein
MASIIDSSVRERKLFSTFEYYQGCVDESTRCPVCNDYVSNLLLNAHLNFCLKTAARVEFDAKQTRREDAECRRKRQRQRQCQGQRRRRGANKDDTKVDPKSKSDGADKPRLTRSQRHSLSM